MEDLGLSEKELRLLGVKNEVELKSLYDKRSKEFVWFDYIKALIERNDMIDHVADLKSNIALLEKEVKRAEDFSTKLAKSNLYWTELSRKQSISYDKLKHSVKQLKVDLKGARFRATTARKAKQ